MPLVRMRQASCPVGLSQAAFVSVQCQGLHSQAARADMDKMSAEIALQAMDMGPSDSKADGSAVSASTGELLSSQHSHPAIAPCCTTRLVAPVFWLYALTAGVSYLIRLCMSAEEAKGEKQSGEEAASSGPCNADDELLNTKDLNFFGDASVIG